jgi:hypothetical protein
MLARHKFQILEGCRGPIRLKDWSPLSPERQFFGSFFVFQTPTVSEVPLLHTDQNPQLKQRSDDYRRRKPSLHGVSVRCQRLTSQKESRHAANQEQKAADKHTTAMEATAYARRGADH